MSTPALLAREFSRALREWLTPSEMGKVIAGNRREPSPGVCHSHDYCDANMVMSEAFEATCGRSASVDGDADAAFWSEAWDIAHAAEFDAGPLFRFCWHTGHNDPEPYIAGLTFAGQALGLAAHEAAELAALAVGSSHWSEHCSAERVA